MNTNSINFAASKPQVAMKGFYRKEVESLIPTSKKEEEILKNYYKTIAEAEANTMRAIIQLRPKEYFMQKAQESDDKLEKKYSNFEQMGKCKDNTTKAGNYLTTLDGETPGEKEMSPEDIDKLIDFTINRFRSERKLDIKLDANYGKESKLKNGETDEISEFFMVDRPELRTPELENVSTFRRIGDSFSDTHFDLGAKYKFYSSIPEEITLANKTFDNSKSVLRKDTKISLNQDGDWEKAEVTLTYEPKRAYRYHDDTTKKYAIENPRYHKDEVKE